MNKALISSGSDATMTHKEIADLTGSRIDSVKRTIERLAENGIIRLPPLVDFEEINNLGLSVKRECYRFDGEQGKRDSIVVVAQLSPEFTAQLVDHWRELEAEILRYHNTQPARQEISMNNDILSLARVVAEATASATMKAVMEVSGLNVITQQQPLALPAAEAVQQQNKDEFVPISVVSWATGLSDGTCRRLITFAGLPTSYVGGVRGLHVGRETFMKAAQTLLDESTPPTGKLKRWQHPEFGGFELRIKSETTKEGDEE